MFSEHHRLHHIPQISNGPLSHPTAQDYLLLERTGTGSLSHGPHRLLEGGEVDLGYRVCPLRPHLASWTCVHDLIRTRLPRLALLSVVVAVFPSKGVLEDAITAASIPRLIGVTTGIGWLDSPFPRQNIPHSGKLYRHVFKGTPRLIV